MSHTDELIARISEHLEALKKLSPKEIKVIITGLKKEKEVWASLASGNRDFLEQALANGSDNFLLGAIPHLTQALPHRLGFIASLAKKKTIGDPVFDAIITGKTTLDRLSSEQLIQFVRDFHHSDRLKKAEKASWFANYKKTIQTWIDAYDRKHARNVDEAHAYIKEKRDKILNLFVNAILPNMIGAIARGEI